MLIGIRQQRQKARPTYGELQLALVMRARARDAARDDLAGFGDVALERRQIFVVDLLDVIGGESAKLLATKKRAMCAPLPSLAAHRHVVIVAVVAEIIVTTRILVGRARHRRGLGDGFFHFHHQAAQHGVAETE